LGIRINPVAVSIVSWGIAGIATIVLLVWFVTGLFIYNAFAVYIDGEHVGYIPIRDELTSEDFHNYAVISLQNSLAGARVRVNETITIEETRTSNSNRMQQSEMFGRLQTMFTFEIAATAIYVDGNFEVLLRTASCLNHVKHDLEYEFRNDYTVRAEFIEGWEERIYYVDPEEADFWTAEEAYHVLSRPTMQMYPYIVRDGDFLGTIAVRFGTRVDIIMRDNNLPNTDIFPGDRLYILTSRPLLSVRTFDEIVTIEAVEMPIETRYNPAMAQAMTRTIQEGTPGQQRSVLQIMREDGIERSRTVLDAEVIVEPVARIIEVGTGTGGMEVR
jgi:LysM repeat protein